MSFVTEVSLYIDNPISGWEEFYKKFKEDCELTNLMYNSEMGIKQNQIHNVFLTDYYTRASHSIKLTKWIQEMGQIFNTFYKAVYSFREQEFLDDTRWEFFRQGGNTTDGLLKFIESKIDELNNCYKEIEEKGFNSLQLCFKRFDPKCKLQLRRSREFILLRESYSTTYIRDDSVEENFQIFGNKKYEEVQPYLLSNGRICTVKQLKEDNYIELASFNNIGVLKNLTEEDKIIFNKVKKFANEQKQLRLRLEAEAFYQLPVEVGMNIGRFSRSCLRCRKPIKNE